MLIKEMYRRDFLPGWLWDRLCSLGEVELIIDPQELSAGEFAGLFSGRDAVITSWDMPLFERSVLERADNLKIISHAGGEMRFFLPEEIFNLKPEVVICHAAGVMALPVAEHTLCVALACLRNLFHFRQWVINTENWWDYDPAKNRSLLGKKVGIVGLGAIAREFIGVPIVNTAMLGALVGATGIVSLDSVKKAIAGTLPEKIVDRNIAAAEAAYRKVGGK